MRAIELDLGQRCAIVRGDNIEQDRLDLTMAAAGQVRELWEVFAGINVPRRGQWTQTMVISPEVALNLNALALIPNYVESLSATLGSQIQMSPALLNRLKKIQRKVRLIKEPIKSNSKELIEAALPFQRRLEASGLELSIVQIRDAAVLAARGGGLLAYRPRQGKTRTSFAATFARGTKVALVVGDSGPLTVWRQQLMDIFGYKAEQLPMLAYSADLGLKQALPQDRTIARAAAKKWVKQIKANAGGLPIVALISFHVLANVALSRKSNYTEYPFAKAILRALRPKSIIVDEAHHASNRVTRHAHIMNLLSASMHTALTGTPTSGRVELQTTIPNWLARGLHRFTYPYRRRIKVPWSEEPMQALNQVYDPQMRPGFEPEWAMLEARADVQNATGRARTQVLSHLAWHHRTRSMVLERDPMTDQDMKASLPQLEPLPPIVEEMEMEPSHEAFYQAMVDRVRIVREQLTKVEEEARKTIQSHSLTDEEWEAAVRSAVIRARHFLHLEFNNLHCHLSMNSTCPWDARVKVSGRRYLGKGRKYERVLEIANNEVAAGNKVIVLTSHRSFADQLKKDLAHLGFLDCTHGLVATEKKALEVRLRSDPTANGMILSAGAAGEGFDFSGASVMIVADCDARLTKMTQATQRICGPRQMKQPRFFYLMHKLAKPVREQVTVDQSAMEYLTMRKAHADLAVSARGTADLLDWEARAARLTG